jgi:hypothetical protein
MEIDSTSNSAALGNLEQSVAAKSADGLAVQEEGRNACVRVCIKMLGLEDIRRLAFQMLNNAQDAFESRAILSNPGNFRAQLLYRFLPKSALVQREDLHGGTVLAQRLDCVKQLPLGAALAKCAGNIRNSEF